MLAYLFLLLAVLFKLNLLPHALGFTPVGAALLFFGARGSRRQAWLPLLLLGGADVVLTRFVYAYPLTLDHVVTWAWYAGVIALGTLLARDARPLRVGAAALATSVSFFVVSNLAVWAVWNMYPKTLAGLIECYVAAVPFFRHTLAADLFFSAVMFGTAALLASRQPQASWQTRN